ncbi:YeeE/YedE family protein [Hoeflea sp. YIM 152468]|uniref:YeeE/YedE family protein n=1 Tax=Hoeflea sp. YIM 152468 TaxID=3031759 RepID=UPI0023DC5189|nr:YeeE/YedE family protein [Hoeflea sp. YIM 152468]MDF1608544.1 YeeE/YedE family protein [Hoeflea sp. YIM 152468]
MDLVPLIDLIGEPQTALVGGLVLGLAFGVFAQRSRYCTRSAVLSAMGESDLKPLATWAAGFAAAILAVQLLLGADMLDVSETRFFSTAQSLTGALFGGLVFGIGMVLTRGCVSRLLVLGASGNLRGMLSIAIVAITALATYSGVLVPLRDSIGGVWNTAAIGGNDLLAHAGLDRWAGIALGAVLAVIALGVAAKARLSFARLVGGTMIGLTVAAGWYFTWQLSTQVFEPIQAESLSFIRPLATTSELALQSGFAGLDQGVLLGAVIGAFAAALISGEFRISTFSEPGTPSIWRYAAGSVLMGFGGILAVGCTIGAGLTGGSVLAVSSLLGLASMITGAALTQLVLRSTASRQADTAAVMAAE